MAKKKRSLIQRLLIGSEKSEGYARSTLPSNRWELFKDIFFGKFGKVVIINLLMLVFFLPLLGLILLNNMYVTVSIANAPFSQCFGVGYQSVSSLVGLKESINLNANMSIFILLPVASIIASFGLAGGAYVIRNMIWTEGIFVANDFWRGIKQNIKQILVVSLIYSLILYITIFATTYYEQSYATGNCAYWMLILVKSLMYVFLAFITIMSLHFLTMSVTYKLDFRGLIKNSFLLTIGLLPQNIFFILLGCIPLLLTLLGSLFTFIAYILILLFGFSLFMLVWTDYSQWIYDQCINDKIPGAQKNRGIYEKVKESDSKALQQYREQVLVSMQHCSLNNRPIKPITDDELQLAELSTGFNRSDIMKLNESRRILYEDNERYIEEHKNDPEFAPTEEELELKKKEDKRLEKIKKTLDKHNKKR